MVVQYEMCLRVHLLTGYTLIQLIVLIEQYVCSYMFFDRDESNV